MHMLRGKFKKYEMETFQTDNDEIEFLLCAFGVVGSMFHALWGAIHPSRPSHAPISRIRSAHH
jgi:hypothetical protein